MSRSSNLTVSDLRHLKAMLLELKLVQAAALVAAGVSDDKKATDYMKSISRMEKLLEFELKDRLA